MKEKTRELIITIGVTTLGFAGLLTGKFIPEYTGVCVAAAALCFTFTLWSLVRAWWRTTPFKTNTTEFPWKANAQIQSNLDVWIHIPRSVHKKGPEPKVKVKNWDEMTALVRLVIKPDIHGDVFIYPHPGHFSPNWAETYLELDVRG